MCGIVGFTGRENKKLLNSLLKTIKHRGYDDTAYYLASGINLGMNRFAIIDLSIGLYPMIYKHYVLMFNGEIYNFRELRKALEEKGVTFKTNCDAEVILPLFDLYKEKAFTKLEGMFALCIFDNLKKELILARDKSGEKPLYYTNVGRKFIFASELKTILASSFDERYLETASLSSYFHHGSVFGNKTLVENVEKLLPSQYLVFNIKNGKIIKSLYWSPKIKPFQKTKSLPQFVDQLSYLIETSVKKMLLADVPVGSFLSGGVDSSLVTYFAAQNIKKLKTFSVAFPGSLKYNEATFARKTASYLETNHTEIICTPEKLIPVIEKLGKYIDEPIVDPAVLPTFFLAKEARKSVKIVLSGEGADELFGGYYRYHKELLANKIRGFKMFISIIKPVRYILTPNRLDKLFSPLHAHYSPQTVWTSEELGKLLKIRVFIPPMSTKIRKLSKTNPLLAMQLFDYRGYLAEQLLMKVDKTTMIHNLESRAPYLDAKIINFAFALQSNYKIRGIHGKYILKKVAESFLPKSVVWKPKHGFSLPLDSWFRGPWKDVAKLSLEELKLYYKVFNIDYYQEILSSHFERKSNYGNKIFSLVALAKWLNYHRINI